VPVPHCAHTVDDVAASTALELPAAHEVLVESPAVAA